MSKRVRKLDPNIGLKKKKKKELDYRRNTYLGENPTKKLPATIPKEIREAKKDAEKRATDLLNEHIEDAVQVLIEGIHDKKDKWYRYNCALALIKKVLPDKKSYSGKIDTGNGKVVNNYIDRRGEVVNILNVLDGLGFEELRKRATDGSVGLLEPPSGGEEAAEAEILEEEGETSRRKRSRNRSRSKEGTESSILAEIE